MRPKHSLRSASASSMRLDRSTRGTVTQSTNFTAHMQTHAVNTVSQFIRRPDTALVCALVLGAVGLSGHSSITATRLLLFAAWLVAIFGFWIKPWSVGNRIVLSVFITLSLTLLGYWFRPDVLPAYFGVLSPQNTLLFSPDGGKITKIQIGQSRVFIVDPDNPHEAQLFSALRTSQFKVENIGGEITRASNRGIGSQSVEGCSPAKHVG